MLTDAEANDYINHMLRAQAYTPPAGRFLVLFTDSPSPSGGGTEVADATYARQSITLAAPSPNRMTHNTNQIVFPSPTVGYGTVTHVGIASAVTAGYLRMYTPLTRPLLVPAGGPLIFEIGDLVFQIGA